MKSEFTEHIFKPVSVQAMWLVASVKYNDSCHKLTIFHEFSIVPCWNWSMAYCDVCTSPRHHISLQVCGTEPDEDVAGGAEVQLPP